MEIKLNSVLANRDRSQQLTLKVALIELLDNASPGEREKARQLGRLADRVSEADASLEVDEVELKLIRECVDGSKGFKVWAYEAFEYYLWPHEMADSDKKRLERRLKGE